MYPRPAFDVALSYLVFYALLSASLLGPHNLLTGLFAVILLSLATHRIGLFLHAASHYEFHRIHSKSDLLYLIYLGWFLGVDLKGYRRVHSLHHLHHGTEKHDPEDTYSNGFQLSAIAKAMIRQPIVHRPTVSRTNRQSGFPGYMRIFCMFFHVSSLIICLNIAGLWGLVIYAAPVFFGCQAIVYLRNCLEHTSVGSASVSRNFRRGLVSFFLGAAGFASHGFHHESPSTRYWLLPADESSTTYYTAFRQILKANA
jgi:fatty acid desaturase